MWDDFSSDVGSYEDADTADLYNTGTENNTDGGEVEYLDIEDNSQVGEDDMDTELYDADSVDSTEDDVDTELYDADAWSMVEDNGDTELYDCDGDSDADGDSGADGDSDADGSDTGDETNGAEVVDTSNEAEVLGEPENDINEYNQPFTGELTEADFDAIFQGLDEYDFHGIDCLEDTERLDTCLEGFSAENWDSLTLDEKKGQIQGLADYIAEVTMNENPPEIVYYNNPREGDYGGFIPNTNTLQINEYMLYQNDEAADTVVHEMWHAHQYQRACNPSTKMDHMYRENYLNYIRPQDDEEGYNAQLLESEARAFAQQVKDRIS